MSTRYLLILGSKSPRRQKLLSDAGIPFITQTIPVDEVVDRENPERLVSSIATQKAMAHTRLVHKNYGKSNCILLTADTLVFHKGLPVGKPADVDEARHILKQLSGRTHEVYTGVCLRLFLEGEMEKEILWSEKSEVEFFQLRDWQLDWYLQSDEWMDKAGGYAIQGSASHFVKRLVGSYSNVVGLPVGELLQQLEKMLKISRERPLLHQLETSVEL